jgi:hypothetical protein
VDGDGDVRRYAPPTRLQELRCRTMGMGGAVWWGREGTRPVTRGREGREGEETDEGMGGVEGAGWGGRWECGAPGRDGEG